MELHVDQWLLFFSKRKLDFYKREEDILQHFSTDFNERDCAQLTGLAAHIMYYGYPCVAPVPRSKLLYRR